VAGHTAGVRVNHSLVEELLPGSYIAPRGLVSTTTATDKYPQKQHQDRQQHSFPHFYLHLNNE
jgi:hypothetical protein